VLSIKHQRDAAGREDPAAVRAKAWCLPRRDPSMHVSGGVLLVLRAGGEHWEWGFHCNRRCSSTCWCICSRRWVNLSACSSRRGLAGVGDNLTQGDGYRASFFTGVLATLVATPAPRRSWRPRWRGLTQAPFNALCIFAALGVGISLPVVRCHLRRGCAACCPTRCLDGHAEAGFCIPVYQRPHGCCGWSRRKHRVRPGRGTRRKHSRRAGGVVLFRNPAPRGGAG